MEVPPEIAYRHVDPSESERAFVDEHIAKLERYCDHITSCSVSIEREQLEAATGDTFRVRVRVHVPPHHELIGEHTPTASKSQVGLTDAINDAFKGVERQLRRLNDKQNDKSRRR